MREVKRKGGSIFILESRESCPPGDICFLEDEFEWAKKIAYGMAHDPEALKSFWETCFERKRTIPGYLLFQDFPLEEEKVSEKAKISIHYCTQIIAMLRGKRVEKSQTPQGD